MTNKVTNKTLVIITTIIIVLLAVLYISKTLDIGGNTVKENTINPELEKYRSADISEDCRLPEYQDNLESWKEHLSHHQETLYCLEYYG